MGQTQLLYDHSSLAIAASLFIAIAVFNEIGYRLGRFVQLQTPDEVKTLTGSIQGSILGLLALLLGFTFSMSIQRFDSRSMALIDEANAIGTAQLRILLLPQAHQAEAAALMNEYVRMRVSLGHIDLTQQSKREAFRREVARLQSSLWALAVAATDVDPRPVTTGVFVKSLNDAIDSEGKRSALLQMHVPEVVLLLLFIAFISSGGIMGYSAGLSGTRMLVPLLLVSALITLIVFIIIDLDRPRRGLIQTDQSALISLLPARADET